MALASLGYCNHISMKVLHIQGFYEPVLPGFTIFILYPVALQQFKEGCLVIAMAVALADAPKIYYAPMQD